MSFVDDQQSLALGFYDELELSSKVDAFSKKFDVSPTSAEVYVAAVESAQQGDIRAFEGIGLNFEDLKAIFKLKMPTADSVAEVAQTLNTDFARAELIVASLIEETDSQFSNAESAVWAFCTSTGQWKTPENSYCKNSNAHGCSPEKGASRCLPSL